LIIDDDEFYREFLVTAVSRQGHKAFQLLNGQDAAECIERWRIDLVITDIFMPLYDGLEVVQALKESHPSVPVIALTEEMVETRELYTRIVRKFGAVRALSKTIKPSSLMDCIKEFLPVVSPVGGLADSI